MNQVQEGLFAVEEQMPCSPKDIKVWPYCLPSTLNRAEREEAAARILTFSQKLDQWVGVSWPQLVEMMKHDYELEQKANAIRRHNMEEEWRVANELRRRRTLSIITLGLYALFVEKPSAQLKEELTEKVPFTIVFLMGPNAVIEGIHELVERGFLQHVQEGDGENKMSIFFPTPSLVNQIMKVQKIAVH